MPGKICGMAFGLGWCALIWYLRYLDGMRPAIEGRVKLDPHMSQVGCNSAVYMCFDLALSMSFRLNASRVIVYQSSSPPIFLSMAAEFGARKPFLKAAAMICASLFEISGSNCGSAGGLLSITGDEAVAVEASLGLSFLWAGRLTTSKEWVVGSADSAVFFLSERVIHFSNCMGRSFFGVSLLVPVRPVISTVSVWVLRFGVAFLAVEAVVGREL